VLLSLTKSRNGSLKYADCKQNRAYWFRIINLLFTVRKWPTFNAKVAEFFVANKWFFMPSPMFRAFQCRHC